MTAKFFVNAIPSNPSNWLVLAVYDSNAPGIVVQSQQLPKPYGGTIEVQFLGLDPIEYNYKLFESVNDQPVGTVLNAGSFQPGNSITTVRGDLYLEADVTPGFASGQNAYVDTTLAGWGYEVERVGSGTMYPDNATNISDPDYTQDVSGGWHLLHDGDLIQPNEKFVVKFNPIVAPAQQSSASIISAAVIITDDTTLDNTYIGKALLLQGGDSSMTLTLPMLSSVAENKPIWFFSQGGSHVSAIIQRASSDTIQWFKNTKIILCQNEQLALFKANGKWNVMIISDSVLKCGEIFYSHSKTIPGAVYANGSLLSRTSYARLTDYVNDLPAGALATEATWGNTQTLDGIIYPTNKGKWTPGDGSTNIRIPDLRNQFIRALDDTGGGRTSGSLQADAIPLHGHDTLTGKFPGSPNGVGPSKSSGGYKDVFVQQTDLTSRAVRVSDGGFMQRQDTECRPMNVTLYPMIRI